MLLERGGVGLNEEKTVLVFQIIGVLPDVHTQNRSIAIHQWAVLVGSRRHFQLAVFVDDEPGPAATETSGACGFKLLFEHIEAAEGGLNVFTEVASRFTVANATELVAER